MALNDGIHRRAAKRPSEIALLAPFMQRMSLTHNISCISFRFRKDMDHFDRPCLKRLVSLDSIAFLNLKYPLVCQVQNQ